MALGAGPVAAAVVETREHLNLISLYLRKLPESGWHLRAGAVAAAVVEAEGFLGHGQVEGEGVGAHGVVDRQPPDALHGFLCSGLNATASLVCMGMWIVSRQMPCMGSDSGLSVTVSLHEVVDRQPPDALHGF